MARSLLKAVMAKDSYASAGNRARTQDDRERVCRRKWREDDAQSEGKEKEREESVWFGEMRADSSRWRSVIFLSSYSERPTKEEDSASFLFRYAWKEMLT